MIIALCVSFSIVVLMVSRLERYTRTDLRYSNSFVNNCPHRGGIDFTPIQIFLFTVPIGTMLKPVVHIRAILYICFQAIYIIIIQYPWFSSWAAVATVVIMAATWLLAVILIRIPITRRIFLKDSFKLPILCWAFYGLLVVAIVIYDDNGETAEVRSLAGKFAAA